MLMLDGIGAGVPYTAHESKLAYQLINDLYLNKKIVIVTGNMALDELGKVFGANGWDIVSRLSEMCPDRLDVTGEGGSDDDYRLRGSK